MRYWVLSLAIWSASSSAATLKQNCAGRTVRCYGASGYVDYAFDADATRVSEYFVKTRRQAMGSYAVQWRGDRPHGRDGIALFYAEGGQIQAGPSTECSFVDY